MTTIYDVMALVAFINVCILDLILGMVIGRFFSARAAMRKQMVAFGGLFERTKPDER